MTENNAIATMLLTAGCKEEAEQINSFVQTLNPKQQNSLLVFLEGVRFAQNMVIQKTA